MLVTAVQIQARIRASRPLRILKADSAEARYALGVAYAPGMLDGHGEYMAPETVEQAAWGFLQDGGRQIGLYHQDGTTGHGQVVESYVYRGPDWETTDAQGRDQVIRAGAWLLGVRFDPDTWRLIRSGRLTGWSIDGLGKRVQVQRSAAPIN